MVKGILRVRISSDTIITCGCSSPVKGMCTFNGLAGMTQLLVVCRKRGLGMKPVPLLALVAVLVGTPAATEQSGATQRVWTYDDVYAAAFLAGRDPDAAVRRARFRTDILVEDLGCRARGQRPRSRCGWSGGPAAYAPVAGDLPVSRPV